MNRLLQRLLLCSVMVGLLSIANVKDAEAQALLGPANWEALASEVSWLDISGNTTRGIAVNPVTGNILVATRPGGAPGDNIREVRVLNSDDGSEIGMLDMTGVSGGYFVINRIATSDDGQIFVGNFSLSGPEFRIYWWEDENAVPKMVFDGNPISARVGDGFGVVGSGDGIKVYASGTFTDKLAEFTWDPVQKMLTDLRVITLPGANHANASIIGAPGENALWINGRDASILKIDLDGQNLVEIGSDVVASGNGELDLMTVNGTTFLVTGVRGTEDNVFTLIDITDEAAPFAIAVTPNLTYQINDFRVGDVAFDETRETLTVLVTNNVVANFTIDVNEIVTDELIGSYYIPKGGHTRGFESLKVAFDSLNVVGANGPVTLYITEDLNEGSETLRIDRADLTSNSRVTIRPLTGTSPTVTVGNIRFVDTGYITLDGSADGSGQRDLTLVKNSEGAGFINLMSHTRDIFIRNLNVEYEGELGAGTYAILINRREAGNDSGRAENARVENVRIGTGVKPFNDGIWLLGSTTVEDFFHRDVVISGNEFHAGRSALRTQTHTNTIFENNIIKLYGSTGIQGINLNTPIDKFTAHNNEFEIVTGSVSDATTHVAINITNTLVEANFYNNTVAINYDGAGSGHNFYAIRHGGTITSGPLNFYHNTFKIGNTGQGGTHAVLGRTQDASTGLTVNMINNIMVSDRNAANSIAYEWASGSLSANFNNIYFPGAGLVGKVGENEYADITDWFTATGRDQRSSSVSVTFESDSDLRLAGASIGDIRLAGTPIEAVAIDIDGRQRDGENPYMGAFEGDIVLIPEPEVREFVLLQPESGASVNLNEVEEVVIEWEFPSSTVAWSRMNGLYTDDQFAHVGDGNSGQGRYIGTSNDVDAWLKTPLLINPGKLSFWAATYSNVTVLNMVIEISEDGENWTELQTLSAVAGGTGDINIDWSYHEVDINEEGEFYVRFSQSGEVSGSFFLDDVKTTSSLFAGETVLDEDFESWSSFRSMRFTWHLDEEGNFGNADLSLSSDLNGETATLTLTSSQVDVALANLGVDEGATFSGSWTVTTVFGNDTYTAEEPFQINVTRKITIATDAEADQPYVFALNQNYPNPFNPMTKIEFSIPESMEVRLEVYNVSGQRVATLVNEQREAGIHTVNFDGARLASGIYIYRIQAGSFVRTQKMTLIK